MINVYQHLSGGKIYVSYNEKYSISIMPTNTNETENMLVVLHNREDLEERGIEDGLLEAELTPWFLFSGVEEMILNYEQNQD